MNYKIKTLYCWYFISVGKEINELNLCSNDSDEFKYQWGVYSSVRDGVFKTHHCEDFGTWKDRCAHYLKYAAKRLSNEL